VNNRYEAEKERILDQVRNRLEELFPSKACRFSKVCSGYRKEAFTCQHEGEASTYCGLYKRHEAAVLQGQMKKMLAKTDFGNFDI
jgi:hypothetical protein